MKTIFVIIVLFLAACQEEEVKPSRGKLATEIPLHPNDSAKVAKPK